MKRRGKESGFTLIEMMIVVSIIGILSAIAIPGFQKYVNKAKSAEAPIKLKEIYTAISTYYITEHVVTGGGIGNLGGQATGSRCIALGTEYLHTERPHLSLQDARLSWIPAAQALGIADAGMHRFSYYSIESTSANAGQCGGAPRPDGRIYWIHAYANLDKDGGSWHDRIQRQMMLIAVDDDGNIFHPGITVNRPGE